MSNQAQSLRKALQEIYDFSRKNPGCGYSCGTMAKKTLDACEAQEKELGASPLGGPPDNKGDILEKHNESN